MMTRSMSDTKRRRTARKATSPIMAVMPMILSRTCILLGVPAETLLGLFGQEVNQPLRRAEQATVVAAPPDELHAHRQAAFRLQQRQRHRRRAAEGPDAVEVRAAGPLEALRRRPRSGRREDRVIAVEHCLQRTVQQPCPVARHQVVVRQDAARSEEHTSELKSLMRHPYAV